MLVSTAILDPSSEQLYAAHDIVPDISSCVGPGIRASHPRRTHCACASNEVLTGSVLLVLPVGTHLIRCRLAQSGERCESVESHRAVVVESVVGVLILVRGEVLPVAGERPEGSAGAEPSARSGRAL